MRLARYTHISLIELCGSALPLLSSAWVARYAKEGIAPAGAEPAGGESSSELADAVDLVGEEEEARWGLRGE